MTTLVTVRQSAGEDGPRWRRYFDADRAGWVSALETLKDYLEHDWLYRGEDHQAMARSRAPARAPPTSSSSAAASSARAPPGICAGRVHRPRSWSSSAIRPTQRASAFLAMGGIRQQFCIAGHRADGAAQRRACGRSSTSGSRTPAHTPRAWFRQRGYLFLADDAASAALMQRVPSGAARRRRVQLLSRRRDRGAGARTSCSTTSAVGCSDPTTATPTRARCCSACAHAAAARAPNTCTTRSSASTSPAGVSPACSSRCGPTSTRRSWSTPPARWAGRVAALAGLARAGRADAPDAVPRDAAAPLAASLSDGDRSRRRALASRRSGRARASRIASSSHSPSGTSRPARTSSRDDARWEHEFLPALVRRLPAFPRLSRRRRLGGTLRDDARPQSGARRASGARGFVFANGFSGHGLMMSPATGKIVSELVRIGASEHLRHPPSSRRIASSAARWCTTARPSNSRAARGRALAVARRRLSSVSFGKVCYRK